MSSAILPSSTGATLPMAIWRQIKGTGFLGPIILLHVVVFHALQMGMTRPRAPAAAPKEVFATFITSEAVPPALPKPQTAPPKTVPLAKKVLTQPSVTPAPNATPSPQAVTVPVAAGPSPEPPAAAAPPVPSAPAAPMLPKTITSGVEYLQPPQPEYPSIARRMGEEGKALLRVLVNEKGRAERIDLQKSSGSARLDEAARQAVARALFKPYIEDGKAVAVYAIVPIRFQLEN